MTKWLVRVVAVLAFAVPCAGCVGQRPRALSTAGNDAIANAFASHASGVQVTADGIVSSVLPDDNNGDRHQRFIVRLASGQTVLIAHNIDIAPRLPALAAGDSVALSGVYEWNAQGGAVHWTHHDPSGQHPTGWLRYNGRTYQ